MRPIRTRRLQYTPEWVLVPETKSYHSWSYIVEGEGRCKIGQNKEQSFKKNSLLFFPENVLYSMKPSFGSRIDRISVAFSTTVFGSRPLDEFFIMPSVIDLGENQFIRQLFFSLWEEYCQKDIGWEKNHFCYGNMVFQELLRHYKDLFSYKVPNFDPVLLSEVKPAIEYVEKFYREHIRAESMAKLIGISYSSLRLKFKKALGVSFSQYLLNYRLEKVAERLQNGEKYIKKIATEEGFVDHSNFYKWFKQRFRCTPKNYINMVDLESKD